MAFLDPASNKLLKSSDHGRAFIPIAVYETEKDDNKDVPVDRGFAAFFEFRKNSNEDDEPVESDQSEGTGILKTLSWWKEGRNRKDEDGLKETKNTQKLGKKKNGRKTLNTRQEKDAKTKEKVERERIRMTQANIKADRSGSDKKDDESTLMKFNPVSAAQKLLSAVSNKQKSSKEEWIIVASKTSIAPGALVPISAAGLDLLLVASKDGSALHCIANSCPHLGTPLEIGTLERRPVENTNYELNYDESPSSLKENYLAKLLAQDGCEDCIICPLHKTAFALESGEVRGEWCPYPPVVGKVVGTIKPKSALPVFDVRTKGKNIEVRINTPIRVDGE